MISLTGVLQCQLVFTKYSEIFGEKIPGKVRMQCLALRHAGLARSFPKGTRRGFYWLVFKQIHDWCNALFLLLTGCHTQEIQDIIF